MLIASLLLLVAPQGSVPAQTPQQSAGAQVPGDTQRVGREIAARAGNDVLSWAELDALLLDRQGRSQAGREALLHLLKSHVLEGLERERKLRIDPEQVEARWKELDREIRRSGEASGLDAMLRESHVDPTVFRRFLRLSIVQETLARRALNIPADRPVSGEQQEMWLEGVLAERGVEELDPARSGGLLIRCGDVEISTETFAEHLRTQADTADIQDACYQLLLARRMRARLKDITDEAVERAVAEEIDRRRREAEADPRYKGIPFEQLLGAQGLSLDTLRRDPALRIAALARLWVERHHDDAKVREAYLTERDTYDGLFGEALEISALVLAAGRFRNDLVPRTFEEAETVLRDLARDTHTRADFERLVKLRSEDVESRERSGSLGHVTRKDPRVPPPVTSAAFAHLDEGKLPPDTPADDARARLVGPVRTPGGVVLLWLGERRPAPVWDEMASHVRTQLRRDFVEQILTPDQVVTYLDRS